MKDKKILIVIENGIIGLDIRKQLNGYGFNTEIINPSSRDKIEEYLKKGFQLMIIEKPTDDKDIMAAMRLASEYNLPTIYLSADTESIDMENSASEF